MLGRLLGCLLAANTLRATTVMGFCSISRPAGLSAALPQPFRACADTRRRAATDAAASGATGIIIVDHGSRREMANLLLNDIVSQYQEASGSPIVEPAHMELALPSIADAFDRCVARGATRVVCHPFFLSPGRHVTEDIPLLLAAAAESHPEVPWDVSAPLGVQPSIIRAIEEAIGSTERPAVRPARA